MTSLSGSGGPGGEGRSAAARSLLAAVFDRFVPDDGWPAVSRAGLFPYLDSLERDPTASRVLDGIWSSIEALEDAARAGLGRPLDELTPTELDALIAELDWGVRDRLVQAAARAYYGDRDGAGARMLDFRPGGSRDPGAPVVEPELRTTPFHEIAEHYDVVVVGAGAGGGVAACVLAEAGARVLVVDRGEVLRHEQISRDHLRNHRSSVHGQNTGPPPVGHPRVVVDRSGRERVVRAPHRRAWQNNAMVVGGGTRVYQGMAWRLLPEDFRMATTYGVPAQSSLADWPLDHDDLAPHYEWVEWEVGVCGDASGHRGGAAVARGYPMPPLPPNREAAVLAAGARELGLATGPVPLLINSVPRDGRARCVRCGECVGFSCPSDAKNGSHNTVLPRALATGATDLVAGCRAIEVVTDTGGRATGVRLLDEGTGDRRTVRARDVVVAAGAIETARLLLASRGPTHPEGLGNGRDQVGRHLQGHGFVSAFGLFDEPVIERDGPGVSIATLDHTHGNRDDAGTVVGGGVIANEIVKLPIVHWNWALDPQAPRWGAAAKAAMRDTYRNTSHLFAQVQEIPRPGNRVELSTVTDLHGQPVVRLSGTVHPETVRASRYLAGVAERWLAASGARRTWVDRMPSGLLAGQHQAGTCRMGTDPSSSVVDPEGRVHGHDNLWVADASVHVTNGGVNPALTIMALAHRTAGRLLAHRR